MRLRDGAVAQVQRAARASVLALEREGPWRCHQHVDWARPHRRSEQRDTVAGAHVPPGLLEIHDEVRVGRQVDADGCVGQGLQTAQGLQASCDREPNDQHGHLWPPRGTRLQRRAARGQATDDWRLVLWSGDSGPRHQRRPRSIRAGMEFVLSVLDRHGGLWEALHGALSRLCKLKSLQRPDESANPRNQPILQGRTGAGVRNLGRVVQQRRGV